MPSRQLLDEIVPDRPAYLESFDTHTAWVNSRALAAAGLAAGSHTGVLKEAAMIDFERHLPKHTHEEDLDALRRAMRLAASRGIASIQEASHGLERLPLYDALSERGELTLRVRLAFDMAPGYSIEAWEKRLELYREAGRQHGGPLISTGIIKAFADGVVESRTASLMEPYVSADPGDPGACGEPNWERGDLAAAVRVASARGWQVQVHAVGDRAIRDALSAFAGCDAGRLHRVEHVEAPATEDVGRIGTLGVIASMQPQHAEPNKNLVEVWAANLGAERAARGWPWKSILRAGGRVAFGTDWPVVPLDPFASLHVATTRQTLAGEPPGGWRPDERLDLTDALAAWTSCAAYAENMEAEKGMLRAGMLADIAILDRDLANTPAGAIAHTKVEATVVGGRLVYGR